MCYFSDKSPKSVLYVTSIVVIITIANSKSFEITEIQGIIK